MIPGFNVAVQTYNENFNECLSCGEEITHPICPCCLARSFKVWLGEHKEIESATLKRLNFYLKKTAHLNGKRCVRCNSKKIHTCPYCFTEFLYRLIKEAGGGVTLLSEFLFMFNFDFEKKGYSEELEVYGGY